jgi:pimeloyl-ACP methyl ester carboxylesterase
VLSIGGDKSLGGPLGEQAKLIASAVSVVVLKNTGHWIMEERPAETMSTNPFPRTPVTPIASELDKDEEYLVTS